MKAVEVKDTDDDNWIVLAISYYDLAPLAGYHRFYSCSNVYKTHSRIVSNNIKTKPR